MIKYHNKELTDRIMASSKVGGTLVQHRVSKVKLQSLDHNFISIVI